jgi:hypothetical protein
MIVTLLTFKPIPMIFVTLDASRKGLQNLFTTVDLFVVDLFPSFVPSFSILLCVGVRT